MNSFNDVRELTHSETEAVSGGDYNYSDSSAENDVYWDHYSYQDGVAEDGVTPTYTNGVWHSDTKEIQEEHGQLYDINESYPEKHVSGPGPTLGSTSTFTSDQGSSHYNIENYTPADTFSNPSLPDTPPFTLEENDDGSFTAVYSEPRDANGKPIRDLQNGNESLDYVE